ncbi:MAG TPA: NAD(P)-dependent oxidoreductase [Patescibacteria group bacterium]|nr:NAD(P)-dependent oxidoreductase [Patescibacteria group bacterium]
MTKIVVTQPMYFLPRHKERLKTLGDVTFYEEMAKTPEEWLERCQGFDIVCTSIFGLRDKWQELHDVFISLPFVGVGFFDPEKLRANNLIVSNAPGCNRHAVAEWVIGMMIMMSRQLDKFLNIPELPTGQAPVPMMGLADKRVTILGKGNIGTRVGIVCNALEMNVTYFRRGDDLHNAVKDADIVIDTLSTNPETQSLLDKDFFATLKEGVIFISVAVGTVDIEAMLAALDSGKLAYAAHDAVNIQIYDTSDPLYQKLARHPKAYAMPHIAFNTDVTRRIANDMMIDHVEAWLKGEPKNVL